MGPLVPPTPRRKIEAAQPANSELLVDSRLTRADLKATETISRHAAKKSVIPSLRFRQTERRFAFIGLTRTRHGMVNGHAHLDSGTDLRRKTRLEARQPADSGHGQTLCVPGC